MPGCAIKCKKDWLDSNIYAEKPLATPVACTTPYLHHLRPAPSPSQEQHGITTAVSILPPEAQTNHIMRFTSLSTLCLCLLVAASCAGSGRALSWPLCDPAGLVWMTERPERDDVYPGSNLWCEWMGPSASHAGTSTECGPAVSFTSGMGRPPESSRLLALILHPLLLRSLLQQRHQYPGRCCEHLQW